MHPLLDGLSVELLSLACSLVARRSLLPQSVSLISGTGWISAAPVRRSSDGCRARAIRHDPDRSSLGNLTQCVIQPSIPIELMRLYPADAMMIRPPTRRPPNRHARCTVDNIRSMLAQKGTNTTNGSRVAQRTGGSWVTAEMQTFAS